MRPVPVGFGSRHAGFFSREGAKNPSDGRSLSVLRGPFAVKRGQNAAKRLRQMERFTVNGRVWWTNRYREREMGPALLPTPLSPACGSPRGCLAPGVSPFASRPCSPVTSGYVARRSRRCRIKFSDWRYRERSQPVFPPVRDQSCPLAPQAVLSIPKYLHFHQCRISPPAFTNDRFVRFQQFDWCPTPERAFVPPVPLPRQCNHRVEHFHVASVSRSAGDPS